MYPFERFTESAKRALTLAQQEAERAHHSYIGSEHLLLGLLREDTGLGGRVLAELGVTYGSAKQAIDDVLGRNERIIIQQIIPTSRVKRIIELAFAEARRDGMDYVGTEHVLLGILVVGEGVAVQVLQALGVTVDAAQHTITRLRPALSDAMPAAPAPASEQPPGLRRYARQLASSPSAVVERILARAIHEAAQDAASTVDDGHLLLAMLLGPSSRAALTLGHLGVDVERLIRLLHPPRHVVELRRQLRDWHDFSSGAESRLESLRDELRAAEQEWLTSLSEPPR